MKEEAANLSSAAVLVFDSTLPPPTFFSVPASLSVVFLFVLTRAV